MQEQLRLGESLIFKSGPKDTWGHGDEDDDSWSDLDWSALAQKSSAAVLPPVKNHGSEEQTAAGAGEPSPKQARLTPPLEDVATNHPPRPLVRDDSDEPILLQVQSSSRTTDPKGSEAEIGRDEDKHKDDEESVSTDLSEREDLLETETPPPAHVDEALQFPLHDAAILARDAQRHFEEHVIRFIKHLKSTQDVVQALKAAAIPATAPGLEAASFSDILNEMVRDTKAVKTEEIGAAEFVDIFTPLWKCHSYEIAVIIEALGRCACIPTVMLLDALKCVASSLLHIDMDVQYDTYALTQRYWAVVTTDPGSAKSPALKEILQALRTVMSDSRSGEWFHGQREFDYHLVHDCTHAAFNARLQQSQGVAFPATPEGGNLLCESFKKTAVFQKDKIDLSKLLETANGGEYHWSVQENVKARKKKQGDDDQAASTGSGLLSVGRFGFARDRYFGILGLSG